MKDMQTKPTSLGAALDRRADRHTGLAPLSEQIEAALLDRHNGTRGEPLKCDCPFCGMPGKGRWSGKTLNFKCPACSRRNSDPKCEAHIKAMGEKMPPSKSFYGYRELAKQLGVSEKQQQPEASATDGLLEFHPAANIFPLMSHDAFAALKNDIQQHGLALPIELFEGKILDGRNRYRACQHLGIEAATCEIKLGKGGNFCPVEFVLSLNFHRRHLNASQRAMVAARAKNYYADQAKKRMVAGKKPDPSANLHQGNGKASEQAGAAVNVSARSVAHASNVLKKGSEELVKAVDSGQVSVSKAAKIAEVPKKKQADALVEKKSKKSRRTDDTEKAMAEWNKTMEVLARKVVGIHKEVPEGPGMSDGRRDILLGLLKGVAVQLRYVKGHRVCCDRSDCKKCAGGGWTMKGAHDSVVKGEKRRRAHAEQINAERTVA